MANAVNSAQYQARIRQTETLFEGQNFTRRQTINLSGGYEIVKDAYGAQHGKLWRRRIHAV